MITHKALIRLFRCSLIFLVLNISSCIGTDYIDDPIVGQEIIVPFSVIGLYPDEEKQIEVEYYDQYGIRKDVALTWSSQDKSIADVNNLGIVIGKSIGQTVIQPAYNNFYGPEILVTVVDDPTHVATVEIVEIENLELRVGEKFQLNLVVKNINGDELQGKLESWISKDEEIATVSSTGEILAKKAGAVGIYAEVEGVKSNEISISVGGEIRTGEFIAPSAHVCVGTAKLELVGDDLILTLSDNFDTDFALGTFLYLANSNIGSVVRTNGFEITQIFTDGGKTLNISQVDPSIRIDDYQYVIVLCKPASATFGYAEMK